MQWSQDQKGKGVCMGLPSTADGTWGVQSAVAPGRSGSAGGAPMGGYQRRPWAQWKVPQVGQVGGQY